MKKKLLALMLVMAMLLSCMLMLTSCPDSGDGPQGDGELNLDEGISGSQGSSDLTIITDPNDPEAGKGEDNKYIG